MTAIKKILIADDHAIFREGLKQIITRTVDMVVTGEAVNGQEVLNHVREGDYDMILLDISMPGRNGLDVLAEIKSLRPKLPVIILSMHPEEQYAVRAFRTGAAGYVTKGSPPQELVEALEKVALGKKYVSPSLAEVLAASLDPSRQQQLHRELSNREYQVLCMIASGKPVGKIAEELSLSVKTVSTYRANILRKMNLCNNAEITRYAIQNNLS
jgi:two-component system, NarL family, invasion response regulator UvrY